MSIEREAFKAIRGVLSIFPCLLSCLLISAACRSGGDLPDPASQRYRDALSAFYIGVGALQATDDFRAKEKLTGFTQLAPGEPAGWVNLGVLAIRQQEFDGAYENFERARTLAPDNSQIEGMLGLVEERRGRSAEALAHLRRAVELDRKNLKALYALAQEIERQGGAESESEAQAAIERILQAQPENLAAQLELVRIAAKRGDAETARRVIGRIGERASNWPPEVKQQFTALQSAADGQNVREAATRVAFLRNVLVRLPEYRQSLAAIRNPTEETGEIFDRFLKLPAPNYRPAPPDTALSFTTEPIPGFGENQPLKRWVGSISLDGEGKTSVIVGDDGRIQISSGATIDYPALFSSGGQFDTPLGSRVLEIDFNYDYLTDLVLAGHSGVKFYRQEPPGRFIDVTSSTKLPASVTRDPHIGAWKMDVDLDGDLDIVLGAGYKPVPVNTSKGPDIREVFQDNSTVLRNNGDGTFKEIKPFDGVKHIGNLVSADLDGDGDPDVAMIDQGTLKVFMNERLGSYRERAVPEPVRHGKGGLVDIAAADLNRDGLIDLVVLERNETIFRLSDKGNDKDWEIEEVARAKDVFFGDFPLLVGDLDNNGGLDLVWREQLWLSDAEGKLQAQPTLIEALIHSLSDVDGDGRLDLLGVKTEWQPGQVGQPGQPVRLINHGSRNYHYQIIRPRAAKATGDQRINSFGIGGEIEVRSGLLYQKQVITSPVVHFGLGEQTQTDVARFVWPNGSIQGEFELKADQSVLAEQRLKGSCPSLFAWNGKSMEFVKDCAPWSPALGLHINAQVTAGIQQTEEWMKIRGDQLAPRNGYYDLRITAELWETYYIDHYSLLVVDHPVGTEVFTDERFAIPPPELKIYSTGQPSPFAVARDDTGQDVTEVVRTLDDRYLDTFGRGRYQGVTRDHFVELELPEDAPRTGRLWLIAHGFVHPTDGTVNIAMSQPDDFQPPAGLSLEVCDGRGGWRVAKPSLGFPAGKKKTVLVDLTGVFAPGAQRRIRLRTNLELFWDQIEWAAGRDDEQVKVERLSPEVAEIRFRGFSMIRRANDSSPEIPEYNRLQFTGQRWRDLIGYYTRYGDIRELIEKTDDRFVIVNAGDEMRLLFKAPAGLPAGWTRDYVMIGNGWIKDGDYNSTFSKTVLPLPDSKMREYTRPPRRLEDDPVYRRYERDWQEYHTRYVTPDRFRNAMRPRTILP